LTNCHRPVLLRGGSDRISTAGAPPCGWQRRVAPGQSGVVRAGMTGEVSRLRLRHLASSAERIKTTRRISDQPVMPCRAVTTLGAAWRRAGREVQTARTCPARSPGPDPSMKTRRTCPCAPAPSQRGFQKAVVSRSARRQDWRRHRDGFEGLAIDLRGISLDMPFLDFALHFSIRSLVTHGRRARAQRLRHCWGRNASKIGRCRVPLPRIPKRQNMSGTRCSLTGNAGRSIRTVPGRPHPSRP